MKFLLYTVLFIAGTVIAIPFGIYHYFIGDVGITLGVLLMCGFLTVGWLLLKKGIYPLHIYRLNTLCFLCFVLYLMVVGQNDNSMMLWIYIFLPIVFYLLGASEGRLWVLFLVSILLLYFYGPIEFESSRGYSNFFVIRFLLILTILSVALFAYERFRSNFSVDLEEKNVKLLKEVQDREHAEQSLRDSELRYKAIYLQAIEGILLVDDFGDIVECNPQILEMLGYGEKDLIGCNVDSLAHGDDSKVAPIRLGKLHSGETIMAERRMRTASGIYLLCEESGKKLRKNLILLMYRDITERKIAEMALERANQALDKLAHVDGLTQVANRRRFDTILETEWRRMCRDKRPIGLIMGDVDYFKQYNDLYGHQMGDDCLVSIAEVLNSVLHRPADLVARYGGEEFAAILPDTDVQGCMKIAHIMKDKVESLKIPHGDSTAGSYVTMSFGVAVTVPETYDGWEKLISKADKALYRSKEEGRNRVES